MSKFSTLLTRALRVRPYEVELLRPRQAVAPLSWVLLAAGCAALAGAALLVRPLMAEHDAHVAQQARLQAALDKLLQGPPGGQRALSGAKGGERDALAEASLIVEEARRPWHELFDQLEAAERTEGSGVHLVQLNVEPSFASVQLVAEGKDLDKLVRFAQRLAGNGPVKSMALTHHEWHDTLGAHVVTASLRGELDGANLAANDEAGPARAKQ